MAHFKKDDPIFGTIDLDDAYITDSWLVDQYVGNALFTAGQNTNGQLGLANVAHRSSPVQVGSLTNWKQISVGKDYMCAIGTDGTLWSWGNNTDGNLGLLNVAHRSSPVQIGALTNWKSVSAGGTGADTLRHTLAITTGNQLYAWGNNISGQLGDSSVTSRSSPVLIASSISWKQASCGGRHSLGISNEGKLYAWGTNTHGELGDNSVTSRSSPTQIGSLTNWKQVNAGTESSAAITTTGELYVWGDNEIGQLGLQDRVHRSEPVQVGALTNWKQVSAGAGVNTDHMVAVKTDGTLWTWGYNLSGQLGLGDVAHRSSPVQVGSLSNWKYATTGFQMTAAVKTDGTLWVWGSNLSGQLGLQDRVHRSSPVQVGSLTNWKQVSAGGTSAVGQLAAITFNDI